MKHFFLKFTLSLVVTLFLHQYCTAQHTTTDDRIAGSLSLGLRTTISAFSDDGIGLGTGGQFRIRLADRINTDWFADYISITQDKVVQSKYAHIGWSVLFYPLKPKSFPTQRLQPFILAGHCFDYNEKKVILQPSIQAHRWGSAVQAGLGSHVWFSKRCDFTIKIQYMMHLTNELEVLKQDGTYSILSHKTNALEGHLLTTLSINYKLINLW